MPSTTEKQHDFMEAVKHSPEFAKKVDVPQSVGEEFSKADEGKSFDGELKQLIGLTGGHCMGNLPQYAPFENHRKKGLSGMDSICSGSKK